MSTRSSLTSGRTSARASSADMIARSACPQTHLLFQFLFHPTAQSLSLADWFGHTGTHAGTAHASQLSADTPPDGGGTQGIVVSAWGSPRQSQGGGAFRGGGATRIAGGAMLSLDSRFGLDPTAAPSPCPYLPDVCPFQCPGSGTPVSAFRCPKGTVNLVPALGCRSISILLSFPYNEWATSFGQHPLMYHLHPP